jgi:hypothetical protein
MATKEYIDFSNKLEILSYNLRSKKNVEFLLTFRNEKVKGRFLDVTITFYNDDISTKIIYGYAIFKEHSLTEAKAKLEDIYNVIRTLV